MTELKEKDLEIARLRDELAQMADICEGVQDECKTLHAIVASLTNGRSTHVQHQRCPTGSPARVAMLEHAVELLDGYVAEHASYDCYDCSPPNDLCQTCEARRVRDEVAAWRYGGSRETPSRRFVGAMHYRVTSGWDPRETKIHQAWVKYMDRASRAADAALGQILTDRRGDTGVGTFYAVEWPSARDWYVATSVVQWLATNVGSSILTEAGWKYTKWDEDRNALEAKRQAIANTRSTP